MAVPSIPPSRIRWMSPENELMPLAMRPIMGTVAWKPGELPEMSRLSHEFSVDVLDKIRLELLHGRGFSLVHGFAPDGIDAHDLARPCRELCRRLGALVPQNSEGELSRLVTDVSDATGRDLPGLAYGHRGRARMGPHTDSASVAALFCIRPARSGGATSICSAATLYNEIQRRWPEYLTPLFTGFHFDMTGKTRSRLDVTEERIPIFRRQGDDISCVFNRARIMLGMQKIGQPLAGLDFAAVEQMDALASSDELAFRINLRPGDILFLNNRHVLHARDAYEDSPEPMDKRLLIRVWINLPAES